MSEVPYYRLKQLVELTKLLTYYDKKKNKRNNVLLKKESNFAGKPALLRFFSETPEITI